MTIWARNPATADAINRERRNPGYLSDVELPDSVRATADLRDALQGRELVICAVPSHGVRGVMTEAAPHLSEESILVSTVKGIEVDTCMRMDQVFEELCGFPGGTLDRIRNEFGSLRPLTEEDEP